MSDLSFCPQPTPRVSPSPSSPATTDAASTLTGAVIMVSVCSSCPSTSASPRFPVSLFSLHVLPPASCWHTLLFYCHPVCWCVFSFSLLPLSLLLLLLLLFLFCVCWFCSVLCQSPTLLSSVDSVFQKRIVVTALMSCIVQTCPVSA